MLRLSKKADYALMAMKHLAIKTDVVSVSAREIAEEYDIPIELLAKVLQRLVRRGLLTSLQGTRGGYRLSKPSSAITIAAIIEAIYSGRSAHDFDMEVVYRDGRKASIKANIRIEEL